MAFVYRYTAGIAGEAFLREIKENGKIMGARCEKCSITYVPPRMYCERCFESLEGSRIEVGNRGVVHTYTIAHIDENGSKLKEPVIWTFVRIGDGGLIHKLGEIDPKDVRVGMTVEAVLKDKSDRVGSITDIKYFKPV